MLDWSLSLHYVSVYNDFFSFYIYIVMLQERGHIAVTLYSIVSPNVY